MDLSEATNCLTSLERFGSKLGLERIKLLLKKLGNPEKRLKCIHVAGTNGKGSVCAMISAILRQADYKVGLFTSPALTGFSEQIIINGKKISGQHFARIAELVKVASEEVAKESEQPTQFEVITAMAFQYFSEKKVDYAVLEVGLGGRLDSTNAVEKPLVSVITNIDLEHTDVLGNTIHEIAFEKAGIIKQGVPVVTGADSAALGIIRGIAKIEKAKCVYVRKRYREKLGLAGNFQKISASLGIEAIKQAGIKIGKRQIAKALRNVYFPGRFDLRKKQGKNILFDCAHNPAAIKTLTDELKALDYERLILITGILKDKDYKQMLETLVPVSDTIILTKPKSKRAATPFELAKIVQKPAGVVPDIEKAVGFALKKAKKNDLILVTGSHYTVGPAMQHLKFKA